MVSIIEETRASAATVVPPEFASVPRRWGGLARQLPVLPLAILVPFVFMALFADFIAPYDPTEPIPDGERRVRGWVRPGRRRVGRRG